MVLKRYAKIRIGLKKVLDRFCIFWDRFRIGLDMFGYVWISIEKSQRG